MLCSWPLEATKSGTATASPTQRTHPAAPAHTSLPLPGATRGLPLSQFPKLPGLIEKS